MTAMKKYFYIFLMAVVAIAACSKEQENSSVNGPKKVHLTFTGSTDALKTTLDTEDWGIAWSTDDKISVFAAVETPTNNEFTTESVSADDRIATFSGSAETASTYYALSPAQSTATVADALTDCKITANLPSAQAATVGSFDPQANVSVATASNYEFLFKNVGALVGFTIGLDDITDVKIEAAGGEVLSGTVVVDPVSGAISDKTGESSVQLTGSFVNGSTYYFVILPGTYSNGFSITLWKGAQFIRLNKSGVQEIERNANLNLGTLSGSNWKTAFYEGEEVKIKGAGAYEADQSCVYVGSGYWNDITHAAVSDYPYNYEIFTTLTEGEKIYFEAEGGEKFTLNADGTAVEHLSKVANAAYSAPATGQYRIRMVLPAGIAEVRQITAVNVYQNSCPREGAVDGNMAMTYWEKGQWYVSYFCLRRGNAGWANRYKFRFTLKDPANGNETVENYGRHSSNGNNPESYPANYNEQTYFYVQPADGDSFEPGFKFVSTYEIDENRYYARLGLNMNNRLGHYTHTITDILDNRITAGEEVYISGNGVDEAGNKIKMRYSTAFNNAYTNSNAGDEDGLEGASGYNYEAFCKLTSGQRFFFLVETANGQKHYELNADASAVQPLYPGWGAISYDGVANTSVYRVRVNFETGTVSLDRVSEARYLQLDRGTNVQLSTYVGNGVWKLDNAPFGWTHPNAWGNNERYKFWFQIYFIDKSTWQYLGRYDTDQYGVNIQTVTNPSWQWYNKLSAENNSDLNTYLDADHTATIKLKLNADGYTYEFSNITQN